jgi:hypothetical protein
MEFTVYILYSGKAGINSKLGWINIFKHKF